MEILGKEAKRLLRDKKVLEAISTLLEDRCLDSIDVTLSDGRTVKVTRLRL